MECNCEQPTEFLKVEVDIMADPIWCMKCGCNLDIDRVPLSKELKKQLFEWVNTYGKWIDWGTDHLLRTVLN
jgi:hypothetical protein